MNNNVKTHKFPISLDNENKFIFSHGLCSGDILNGAHEVTPDSVFRDHAGGAWETTCGIRDQTQVS